MDVLFWFPHKTKLPEMKCRLKYFPFSSSNIQRIENKRRRYPSFETENRQFTERTRWNKQRNETTGKGG